MRCRLALGPGAPEHAAHVAAFQQHEVERQFRNVAGGEADHEVAAVPGERAQRRLGVAAADRIVDHVDAVFAAELVRARREDRSLA